MSDLNAHYLAFAFILILLVIGLYGMVAKRNLMKKVIAMTIFQNSIILFFIKGAYQQGGTVPIAKVGGSGISPVAADYINPLPHTLMLTAIVVGVAMVGVALALTVAIYRKFGTLEEPALIERME